MSNHDSFPIGGIDYPRTLQEFDEWFSTEEACVDYLNRLRWSEFHLSDMSRAQELAYGNWTHSLRDLRAQNIRHCRHDISGNKEASQVVVSGDVVRNKSKVWG